MSFKGKKSATKQILTITTHDRRLNMWLKVLYELNGILFSGIKNLRGIYYNSNTSIEI